MLKEKEKNYSSKEKIGSFVLKRRSRLIAPFTQLNQFGLDK